MVFKTSFLKLALQTSILILFAFPQSHNNKVIAFPRGLYVSGPPTSARSHSVIEALGQKDFVTGFLVRVGWDDLESAKGVYDFTLLDGELEAASRLGKKVSLGIVNGPHAPAWLYPEGTSFVEISARGRTIKLPVPWDENYLAAWTRFIQKLGEHLRGSPNLTLVHITHSTINGFEMPLAFSPDEERVWQSQGYSADKLIRSWKTVIDAFTKAFPETPLDVEVHPVLRDDSVAQAVVDYGFAVCPSRFGVFAAWWSAVNTKFYFGMFSLIQKAGSKTFAAAQMVASQSPNRFGPKGGIGEGGLTQAFEIGRQNGMNYFEVWETDLQNPELESLFVETAKTLKP
jgi:hypothetical protein